MPPLDNARHERFAQEYAAGSAAGRAYEAAGYEATGEIADQCASRLLATNAKVIARVLEIKEAVAAACVEVTAATVTLELEEARTLAKEQKNASAMVQASMGKAKLAGLIVDRVEPPGPKAEVGDKPMSAEEWATAFCSHDAPPANGRPI